MKSKEIQLQRLAQMTEYFMAKDLSHLLKDTSTLTYISEEEIEKRVQDYKNSYFPSTQNLSESVPDWSTEIGGLSVVKE